MICGAHRRRLPLLVSRQNMPPNCVGANTRGPITTGASTMGSPAENRQSADPSFSLMACRKASREPVMITPDSGRMWGSGGT